MKNIDEARAFCSIFKSKLFTAFFVGTTDDVMQALVAEGFLKDEGERLDRAQLKIVRKYTRA